MQERPYYIGLTMNSKSVGWAVTDPGYHILRVKGKDFWGVRLFNPAETSEKRRGCRTSRRRLQREKARKGILRELFADEIEKSDPGFYARMDESTLYAEDKESGQTNAIFADKDFTDREYFEKYPTIFHLRKELLYSKEPHDVRLLYLALEHMFKHRGHFLNAALGTGNNGQTMGESYLEFLSALNAVSETVGNCFQTEINEKEIVDTLSRPVSRKEKAKRLSGLIVNQKQNQADLMVNMICGLSVKIAKLFPDDEFGDEWKNKNVSFRDAKYEESETALAEFLSDDQKELLHSLKNIHDCGLLASIMKEHKYLSDARVEAYEKHKSDLACLKKVIKKHCPEKYHSLFRSEKGQASYSAYVGYVCYKEKVRHGLKENEEGAFLGTLKKILDNYKEDPDVSRILQDIEEENFLPKQMTAANGVIPNQVHACEMKVILKNAEQYLPFLSEKDETGLTVSEKIQQVFTFTIPYYVGPLGQQYRDQKDYNIWAERKEPGKIYPWNFSDKIDEKKSAEKFIQRMMRHCTYLSGETTLPKHSLLYERYMVLNELNNLCVNGAPISLELKQNIFHDLFEDGKKVSMSRLKNYLVKHGYIDDDAAISGIDKEFQCQLASFAKFKAILGDTVNTEEGRKMAEKIIFWGTVYRNDKKFLKEKIAEEYGEVLTDAQKKKISGFAFSGWGNFSEKFLRIEGKETGSSKPPITLIQALWNTNCNLMQLLSSRFTYKDVLETMSSAAEKPLAEWKAEDLDDLYLSAPVKRMVWQTIRILNEIQKVMSCAPVRIFVEMEREDGEKGKRTEKRKKTLEKLYGSMDAEGAKWKKEIHSIPESDFRNKKLFLYYKQMGKCMYTGEEIDRSKLMSYNLYDIDHIYPRRYIKDDSLENNMVLVKKEVNQNVKKDIYPVNADIQKKMVPFWKKLEECELITGEKFYRLTRTSEFTDEEKAGFISRQLVETRQGAKAITQILKQAFGETEIVFSKAGLVSDFRYKFNLSRVSCVNSCSPAYDAYLNIVVGNAYYVKFTKNPLNFIKTAKKHPENKDYYYHMDKVFDGDVVRKEETAWVSCKDGNTDGTISLVEKTLLRNTPLVTKRPEEGHGKLFDTNLIGKKDAKPVSYLPKKRDPRFSDVTKYGGYKSISIAWFSVLEYKENGKTVRSFGFFPQYLVSSGQTTEAQMESYYQECLENEKKTITDLRILVSKVLPGSLIKYNGYFYYLGGRSLDRILLRSAVQAYFSSEEMAYIKKVEKAVSIKYFQEKDRINNPVLTEEKNNALYSSIAEKFQDTIFKNRIGTAGDIIIKGRTVFQKLSIEEQCAVLHQIFYSLKTGDKFDTSLIGGSKQSGAMAINKKIFQSASELKLICQSVTGVCVKETDLLARSQYMFAEV